MEKRLDYTTVISLKLLFSNECIVFTSLFWILENVTQAGVSIFTA